MSIAATALHQIVIMFLIIIVGMICYKVKLINQETNKKLSDLVLKLVNPLVIFVSYQREFEVSLLKGLIISLILAVTTHVGAIALSRILLRKKNHEENIAIERFAIIYSNCGFMGIPLVNGIFGGEGVFYLTAYMTIFNLFAFTHGMISISGQTDKKSIVKAILSPLILATVSGFLLFMSRIMLPDTLVSALRYIGNMNTPLAMLIAGVTIAQTDLKKLMTKWRIYYIVFLKLIIIPIVMLLIFRLFEVEKMVLLTSVLAAACPTGATINLFAISYKKNYLYASEIFAISTIFSIATIPIIMVLAGYLV